MDDRSRSGEPHHRSVALIALIALAALAGACGSSSGPRTSGPATSVPGGAANTGSRPSDAATTVLAVGGGHVLVGAEVTCHLAKRAQGGVIGTDEGRVEAGCSERHNEESFMLAGTDELDDCYRAVAASSDVTIGPDSFDPAKLDFADERIMGHTFSTGTGSDGGSTVSCAIDLRDDRSTPLLGGSS